MNTVSLSDLYNEFVSSCMTHNTNALNGQALYDKNIEIDGIKFDLAIRDLVVGYSFIKLFLCWENFLEQVFIGYTLDEAGLNGKKLTRYVLPMDYDHAYSLIKGTAQYPDWTVD
jgi:hypothetical protein